MPKTDLIAIGCKERFSLPTATIRINPTALSNYSTTASGPTSFRMKPKPLPSKPICQAQHLDDQGNQLKSSIVTLNNVQENEIPKIIYDTLTYIFTLS